jgi:3-hydroxyisobutyrate dehydrogenase-like beta-hydroxyacid dehydrogenase
MFKEMGGIPSSSPRDVVDCSDIIFLALMKPEIIESVLFNTANGIISGNAEGKVIVNCSTIDPESSINFGNRLASNGIMYLECPIAGGSVQIEQKKASYFVAGYSDLYSHHLSLLKHLSEKIYYIGKIGDALKAKLAINLVLGLNRAALAEGILFSDIMGLDRKTILDLIQNSPADSFIAQTKGNMLIEEDFAPKGYLFQHAKDIGLMLDEARKAGKKLPLSDFHYSIMNDAIEHGDGELDNIAIFKELARKSNI